MTVRPRRAFWIGVAGLLLLLPLGGAAWWAALNLYEVPGPLPENRAVIVPRGSLEQVTATLVAHGIVTAALPFQLAAEVTRSEGPLRAGELQFPEHASLSETLAVLRHGRSVLHRVTIPEGLTAAQIAALIDRATALSGDAVVPDEGGVLPETYEFELGATRASVVERARQAMDHALARLWDERQRDLPYSRPHDMLVLASMVERETAKPEERAHIAGVFVNRLRQGMKLQSDPTVTYAVSGGETLERPLTHTDLAWPNPYNTYTSPGLPPGPIDSPGLAALQAAARPMATGDLYFVADGTGGHAFASTLAEHAQNVARWRERALP